MANDIDAVLHSTLFGEAMQNVAVATFLADEEGRYIAVNEAACELTGYSRKTLTRFRAGELAADERSQAIYENVMRGKKLRGKKQVRRKDGTVLDCRYWGMGTQVSGLPYFVLLLWTSGHLPRTVRI